MWLRRGSPITGFQHSENNVWQCRITSDTRLVQHDNRDYTLLSRWMGKQKKSTMSALSWAVLEETWWCNTMVNMRFFKPFWNMCRDQNGSEWLLEIKGKVGIWSSSISVLFWTKLGWMNVNNLGNAIVKCADDPTVNQVLNNDVSLYLNTLNKFPWDGMRMTTCCSTSEKKGAKTHTSVYITGAEA